MRAAKVALLIILLASGPAYAQEGPQDLGKGRWWSWPASPNPQAVERGKAVFRASCASCHGLNGTGGPANRDADPNNANLTRSYVVRHDKDGAAIAAIVKAGVAGKGMPPIALTPLQVSDVVAYLQHVIELYDRTSLGVLADDYPAQYLLTGNADSGKAYFNGAGGCSGCHSPTGDLAHVATKYTAVQLESAFLSPRTGKPTVLTITTPTGEKVVGERVVQNNYDVSIKLPDGTVRAFDAQAVTVEVSDPLQSHRLQVPKYTSADIHNLFAYLWTLK